MSQPTFVEVAQRSGVKDLPAKVRLHFTKALIAEMEGNTTLAEVELHLAVEAEDALTAPEPVA
jgi:hypothetical protein